MASTGDEQLVVSFANGWEMSGLARSGRSEFRGGAIVGPLSTADGPGG